MSLSSSSRSTSTSNRSIHHCPMCPSYAPTLALILNHLRLVHKNDPRFCVQCGVGGCTYTARKFDSLYSHIYRTHPDCGAIKRRRGLNIDTLVELPESERAPLAHDTVQETLYKLPDISGEHNLVCLISFYWSSTQHQ